MFTFTIDCMCCSATIFLSQLFGDGFHNIIHIPFHFLCVCTSVGAFFTIQTIWCVIVPLCMHKKHLVRKQKKGEEEEEERRKKAWEKKQKKMKNTSERERVCMVNVPQSLRRWRHQQKNYTLSFGVVLVVCVCLCTFVCVCVHVVCVYPCVCLIVSCYGFFCGVVALLYIGMKRCLCQIPNKIAYGDCYRCVI